MTAFSEPNYEMRQLRSLATGGGLFADGDWVETKDQDPTGDIRLLQLADIGDGNFLNKSDRWVNHEALERLDCTEVYPGDLLIARMPDPIARTTVVPEGLGRAITVVDVAILRCSNSFNPRYVKYAINSRDFRGIVESQLAGSTRQRISRSALGRASIPVPPLPIQRSIADYLDRETAEIDAMAVELEELVAMLESRWTASISAEIDELFATHQGVTSLGTVVTRIRTGLNPRDNFKLNTPDADMHYVTVRELRMFDLVIDEKTAHVNREDLKLIQRRSEIVAGDVLFSGTGTIGRTAIVRTAPESWNVKEGVYILTPDHAVLCNKFLVYTLWSKTVVSDILFRSGGSTILSIPIDQLKRVKIPVPPLNEQRRIVALLDEVTAEIESMIADAQELKALLAVRRSALITEVVTGRKEVPVS